MTRAAVRWSAALLVVGGCATRYRYATGQQAELLSAAGATAWFDWHPLAPSMSGAHFNTPGVHYELVTGQTAAAVLAQCGQPLAVVKSGPDAGSELWEYTFGLIRFTRGRLAHVAFNPHASGASYYEQRWCIRWP